jgi:hypothetical protein
LGPRHHGPGTSRTSSAEENVRMKLGNVKALAAMRAKDCELLVVALFVVAMAGAGGGYGEGR